MKNTNTQKPVAMVGRQAIMSLTRTTRPTKMSENQILAQSIIAKSGGGAIVDNETVSVFKKCLRGQGEVGGYDYAGHSVQAFIVWTQEEKDAFLAAQAVKKAKANKVTELLREQEKNILAPVERLGAVSASTPKLSKVAA